LGISFGDMELLDFYAMYHTAVGPFEFSGCKAYAERKHRNGE
jgi:hypothetical protein